MAVAAPQLVAHVAQLCRAICRAFRTRKTAHNLKQGAGGARTSDTHAPGSRGTYCVVGVGGPQQRGRPETMCKPPWCPDTSTGGAQPVSLPLPRPARPRARDNSAQRSQMSRPNSPSSLEHGARSPEVAQGRGGKGLRGGRGGACATGARVHTSTQRRTASGFNFCPFLLHNS